MLECRRVRAAVCVTNAQSLCRLRARRAVRPAAAALFLLLAGAAVPSRADLRNVTIDNTKPRVDVNGVIVDAHDGTVQVCAGAAPYAMRAGVVRATRATR